MCRISEIVSKFSEKMKLYLLANQISKQIEIKVLNDSFIFFS